MRFGNEVGGARKPHALDQNFLSAAVLKLDWRVYAVVFLVCRAFALLLAAKDIPNGHFTTTQHFSAQAATAIEGLLESALKAQLRGPGTGCA